MPGLTDDFKWLFRHCFFLNEMTCWRVLFLNPTCKTDFFGSTVSEDEIINIQKHERTGQPLCATWFLEKLEALLDRPLKPKKYK